MTKKTLSLIGLLLGCLVILTYYLKPYVVVYNKTGRAVYLYQSTGSQNVEPDIEQAEESMRPIVIKNGDYKKIVLSWQDLNLANGQLYLGWKTGRHTGSVSGRSSGKIFDITSGTGHCSYQIFMNHVGDVIEPLDRMFCFSKLSISLDNN